MKKPLLFDSADRAISIFEALAELTADYIDGIMNGGRHGTAVMLAALYCWRRLVLRCQSARISHRAALSRCRNGRSIRCGRRKLVPR